MSIFHPYPYSVRIPSVINTNRVYNETKGSFPWIRMSFVFHWYSIRIQSVYFPIAPCSDFRRIRTEYGWGDVKMWRHFEVYPNNTRFVVAQKPMSFFQSMKVVKLHMCIDLGYTHSETSDWLCLQYHGQHLNLKNVRLTTCGKEKDILKYMWKLLWYNLISVTKWYFHTVSLN